MNISHIPHLQNWGPSSYWPDGIVQVHESEVGLGCSVEFNDLLDAETVADLFPDVGTQPVTDG